jgi:hypothetical protein
MALIGAIVVADTRGRAMMLSTRARCPTTHCRLIRVAARGTTRARLVEMPR